MLGLDWWGGGVLMMIEPPSSWTLAPAEFSYLQPPPPSRTGYSSTFWSFVHVFQHTAPSLAGLNAQARTGLDIFKDGRLVFRGNWGGLSVSRDIQSGWVTGRLGMNGRGWDPVGPWWDPVLYNGSQCTPVGPHYWKASHATGSNCQGRIWIDCWACQCFRIWTFEQRFFWRRRLNPEFLG